MVHVLFHRRVASTFLLVQPMGGGFSGSGFSGHGFYYGHKTDLEAAVWLAVILVFHMLGFLV